MKKPSEFKTLEEAFATFDAALTAFLESQLEKERDRRQDAVQQWAVKCFGEAEARSLPQRGLRLLEEAAEAAQAAGVTRRLAYDVIRHVFSRPAGNLSQEIGGVSITTLLLADTAFYSADQCERDEINRILSKPTEHFTERNQAKNDKGLTAL